MIAITLFSMSLFSFQGTKMVGLSGLEPPTSRLSGGRSNLLCYRPMFSQSGRGRFRPNGGDKRDRTADPLLAKQVLSQLSYTPLSL